MQVRQDPAILLDFQSTYANLVGVSRQPDGRYPEREPRHDFAIPLTEHLRRTAIAAAVSQQIFVYLTNSDGNAARRNELLSLLGPGSTETVLDPGIEVVEARLAGPDGQLSEQCRAAISRWYGRVG